MVKSQKMVFHGHLLLGMQWYFHELDSTGSMPSTTRAKLTTSLVRYGISQKGERAINTWGLICTSPLYLSQNEDHASPFSSDLFSPTEQINIVL